MKPFALIGIVLILGGIAAVAVPRFSYTTEKPIVDIGPLKASVTEEHSFTFPDMAGIGLFVVGAALLLVSRRTA